MTTPTAAADPTYLRADGPAFQLQSNTIAVLIIAVDAPDSGRTVRLDTATTEPADWTTGVWTSPALTTGFQTFTLILPVDAATGLVGRYVRLVPSGDAALPMWIKQTAITTDGGID
jgi:hypothetical protein